MLTHASNNGIIITGHLSECMTIHVVSRIYRYLDLRIGSPSYRLANSMDHTILGGIRVN